MKNFLKKKLLHNIGPKVFSLLIAVIVWSAIMNTSDPYISVTIRSVSVSRLNEDAVTGKNMIYDVVSGDTINVTLNGPRSEVQKMSVDNINAYVNMKELSITNACPIHVSFVDADFAKNVKVTGKTAEAMLFSLENMVTENKQVVCVKSGSCAAGYYAVASVSPATLEVYGSENAVKNIDRLVAYVDITDRSETFSNQVTVRAIDANGNVIPLESTSVTLPENMAEVTVNIYRTKNVKVKLNANVTAGKGFAIDDIKMAPESIAIAGPDSVLNAVSEIILPYEKTDLIETVDDNIMLKEYIPEDCDLVSDIGFVSVRVVVAPLDENRKMSVKLLEVDTSTLNSIYDYNMNQTITVSVWGVKGTTEALTVRDLALYLDLSSIKEEGTYTVPLQWRTTKDIMIDNQNVEVKVTLKPVENEPIEKGTLPGE